MSFNGDVGCELAENEVGRELSGHCSGDECDEVLFNIWINGESCCCKMMRRT